MGGENSIRSQRPRRAPIGAIVMSRGQWGGRRRRGRGEGVERRGARRGDKGSWVAARVRGEKRKEGAEHHNSPTH